MARLRAQAYERFTERLLAREIVPGQFVTQRELVAITGMSLGAIRELIPRLEVDGLISTVPQRGLQVAHVDLDLVRNAFQFRLILEVAAIRDFVRTADDATVATLRAAHEAVLAAAAADIDDALIERAQLTDWQFHDTLIESLGNRIITDAYRVNSIKIRLIGQARAHLYASIVEPVMRDHLAIIAAIESRDGEGAAARLTAHLTAARNRALGV